MLAMLTPSSDHTDTSLLLVDIDQDDAILLEDDEASLAESGLSEEDENDLDDDDRFEQTGVSSVSSMSVFMSSLVGLHAEDVSINLQADNAKPRDLPPPAPSDNSSDVNSNGSKSKNRNKISRWESTPTTVGKSPKSPKSVVPADLTWKRRRAMRRLPGSSGSSNASFSTAGSSLASKSNGSSRKADMPILLPKRTDSSRSLTINAKRPQRLDSSGNLFSEGSNKSFDRGFNSGSSDHQQAEVCPQDHVKEKSAQAVVWNDSMDLRVLLEGTGETMDADMENMQNPSGRTFSGNCEHQECGVFLKIPDKMLASDRSLWSSASTMTASFRTMQSSRSLMNHYSSKSIALEQSSRSLFWQAEEETSSPPMRLPRRIDSTDDPFRTKDSPGSPFRSNASTRPVRRPVRSTSNQNILPCDNSLNNENSGNEALVTRASITSAATTRVAANISPDADSTQKTARVKVTDTPPQQPGRLLGQRPERIMPSFRLIRSLSDQTLEFIWKEIKGEKRVGDDTVRSLLKRSLSDSQMFKDGSTELACE